MNQQITLNILEKDLIAILQDKEETLRRYFHLIREVTINKELLKLVNEKEEFDFLEKETKKILKEIKGLKGGIKKK